MFQRKRRRLHKENWNWIPDSPHSSITATKKKSERWEKNSFNEEIKMNESSAAAAIKSSHPDVLTSRRARALCLQFQSHDATKKKSSAVKSLLTCQLSHYLITSSRKLDERRKKKLFWCAHRASSNEINFNFSASTNNISWSPPLNMWFWTLKKVIHQRRLVVSCSVQYWLEFINNLIEISQSI